MIYFHKHKYWNSNRNNGPQKIPALKRKKGRNPIVIKCTSLLGRPKFFPKTFLIYLELKLFSVFSYWKSPLLITFVVCKICLHLAAEEVVHLYPAGKRKEHKKPPNHQKTPWTKKTPNHQTRRPHRSKCFILTFSNLEFLKVFKTQVYT